MKKFRLLPAMAYRSVRRNAIVYYPYMTACIFSVFTYFIFASLLQNDLIRRLPHAAYAWMILDIGRALLFVILFLFMIYVGSFLQKKRQKEMGLYSLLGMEKKHIAIMLLWENIGIYILCTIAGMGIGAVLGKLSFLILMRMTKLGVEAEFTLSPGAAVQTLQYFALIFLCIYAINLWMLGRMKPVELLAGTQKGEKEPRAVWLWALAGTVLLGWGYYLAVSSQMDSMIFTNFFLAVFFVVLGTYFLFTSGSIVFLKLLRKKKKFYYRPSNIVTISGMLYRMKKNAAGLSNICIFSTMLLITLTCTVALWTGMEEVVYFQDPYDVDAYYSENSGAVELAEAKYSELSEKYGQKASRLDCYDAFPLTCGKKADSYRFETTEGYWYIDQYRVTLLTLADYNLLTQENRTLTDGKVLLYSTGVPIDSDTVDFLGITARIAGVPDDIYPYPQAKNGIMSFSGEYVMVVRDKAQLEEFVTAWAEANGVEDLEAFLNSGERHICLLLDCEEGEKEAFAAEWMAWCQGQEAFLRLEDGIAGRADGRAMNGALLFIGVIFGSVFFMCLLLIMYFKQVAEGYEDQDSFGIMQKVGMSDAEIRRTIHRQILLVFFLPLFGAILHTAVGMVMTNKLLASISFFDTDLLVRCGVGVVSGFALIYLFSYLITARTYYRIVRFGEEH